MKSLIVFLTVIAYTSAAAFDLDHEKIQKNSEAIEKSYPEQLARLFINGLNSTTLVVGVAVLAFLLFFALYAATPTSLASQRYEQDPYSEGYYYEDPQYQTRYKRSTLNGN